VRGEVVELRIESLAAGGDGLGHAPDGLVVFVPFTAPGDLVRVELGVRRARWGRGVVRELLEPGPGRTDPLCAVFGDCGGCSWQHLDYPTQVEAKRTILRDALERIAHVAVPGEITFHPSPSHYGYRSRARVVGQRGRVGFRRRRSNAVCATRRCPILVPELDDALAALAAAPPSRDGEWELAVGSDGATRSSALPVRESSGQISVTVAGEQLQVSGGSFLQANALLRDTLCEWVTEAAGSGGSCLELFCGVGFFTLGLARGFERVLAIESNPHAVADLEDNLAAAGLGNVEILAEPVEHALEGELALAPDVIVLDPPRTGLESGACEVLARISAQRIVYVSCDPGTLARDVGLFVDRGWELAELAAFDLFPQTPHLESAARLERGRTPATAR
jgi:23S rRNA (uracil1939-C5)-methyltransferase